MFQHILIPLDGSALAECALPAGRYLAKRLGAELTLIHVIEKGAAPTVHGERHLTDMEEAAAYLQETCSLAGSPQLTVGCHVHAVATGDVARSIVEHQDELAPDLVVMCTHGSGGLKRMLLGSIAQQVVAMGITPVLLIRPDGQRRGAPFSIETILAPLDGNPAHEQGLDAAADLARATGAKLQLLSVVPTLGSLAGRDATMGRFMPGTTQAMLQIAESDLRNYLTEHVSRIRQSGVPADAELRFGDATFGIVAAAASLDAGIIFLGTHGRAGNEAFWANSVAAKVQAQTMRPLLLVPLK